MHYSMALPKLQKIIYGGGRVWDKMPTLLYCQPSAVQAAQTQTHLRFGLALILIAFDYNQGCN